MADPTRDDVDALQGPVVLEFGASWCPHCQAIQGNMAALLAGHPEVRHIKVEDGPGKPLGRSFRVKLWPTLVFMLGGRVLSVAVRPSDEEIDQGFGKLTGHGASPAG